jgi:hypothetical protein
MIRLSERIRRGLPFTTVDVYRILPLHGFLGVGIDIINRKLLDEEVLTIFHGVIEGINAHDPARLNPEKDSPSSQPEITRTLKYCWEDLLILNELSPVLGNLHHYPLLRYTRPLLVTDHCAQNSITNLWR